jgi:hypothetical protein
MSIPTWLRQFLGLQAETAELPKVGISYYRYLCNELTMLQEVDPQWIEGKTAIYDRALKLKDLTKPTWDDLHMLARYLLALTPNQVLARTGVRIREQYRELATEEEFKTYLQYNPPDPGKLAQSPHEGQPEPPAGGQFPDYTALRNELEYLLGLIYWKYRVIPLREAARTRFAIDCATFQFIFVLFISIIYAVPYFILIPRKNWDVGDFTLLVVMVLGTMGAYTSVQYKVQTLPYTGDPISRIVTFESGRISLFFGIIFGSIFAVMAYCLFMSGAVGGSFFPVFGEANHSGSQAGSLYDFLTKVDPETTKDYGKLFVWSFVAGFAERLIPDTLNRLIEMNADRLTSRPAISSQPLPPRSQ